MDKVFVDTSFFIALLNSRDADHPRAIQLQENKHFEQAGFTAALRE